VPAPLPQILSFPCTLFSSGLPNSGFTLAVSVSNIIKMETRKQKRHIYAYIIVAVLAVSGAFTVSYIKAYNTAVNFETRLVVQWEKQLNILSQYSLKINNTVQVPAVYKDDFALVLKQSMNGHYGKKGQRVTFQWLDEHGITVSNEAYLLVQQIIESGQNHYATENKKVLDLSRAYKKVRSGIWTAILMGIAGYPSADWK